MCEQSNKMEEHVHRTQIPLLLISKQGHNSRTEKVVKFEIKLGLFFDCSHIRGLLGRDHLFDCSHIRGRRGRDHFV
jgi:hypothetical protein